jgi:pimeloyl-ACP methyl ester carboxylesterase
MINEKIHFAHANGFPAKTYNKLFSFLKDDFEIGYLERIGHDPNFPVTDGWEFLKKELQTEIENRYEHPIIGIGHSLGGVLHLMVAAENPKLYRQIILLDAPVISRLSSLGLKILKKANLMEKYSPSRLTKFRRSIWQNEDEAFEHFNKKEKFNVFDKDVLRDYVKHGTTKSEKGIELFYKPRIEAQIYETIPASMPKLRGKLKIPVSYIGGTNSREARLARLGFMKKHFPINFYFLKGSHLFPFENPQKTAEIIKKAITSNATQ